MTSCFEISGSTLEHLPEIFEKLFLRLEELLIAKCTLADEVLQVIANIKAKTQLLLFLEIVALMDKTRVSEGGTQQLRYDIANLEKTETNDLLVGIKDLLISRETSSDSSSDSAANAEFDTVNQMRAIIEQMLVVNGIQTENAKQAVDDLQPDILSEMLDKVKFVFANLKAIRAYNQTDLLIKFNIMDGQENSLTSVIVEALKKGGCTFRKTET